ncbi:hypothetical protein [Salinarimonas sp.]
MRHSLPVEPFPRSKPHDTIGSILKVFSVLIGALLVVSLVAG